MFLTRRNEELRLGNLAPKNFRAGAVREVPGRGMLVFSDEQKRNQSNF